MTENRTKLHIPESVRYNLIGTSQNVDVAFIPIRQAYRRVSIASVAEIQVHQEKDGIFKVTSPLFGGDTIAILTNFDPKQDKVRVAEGDFTLDEIMRHGANAPYCRDAAELHGKTPDRCK